MSAIANIVHAEGTTTSFDQLVQDLSDALGPSSGVGPDDVDPTCIQDIMRCYQSDESQWAQYALPDLNRSYTRNLVDEGNGKSNLLVLVWTPGQGSPIHDHANAHCVMKILKGSLTETLYAWPSKAVQENLDTEALQTTKESCYQENDVAYMSDRLGLHRMANNTPEIAVSLHLYTPPNAVTHGCHIFEETTGKQVHIPKCVFYSEYGSKL